MWIADTYPNIKFACNMHSFGGYFMWSPGAYLDDGKRTTSPAPNIGVEKYFFQAGEKILGRIKEIRGTVILPAAHGPDRGRALLGRRQLGRRPLVPQGHHRLRLRDRRRPLPLDRDRARSSIQTGFQPPFGTRDRRRTDARLANEGRDQAMEFASGNFGMIEAAYDYALDTTPPQTAIESRPPKTSGAPVQLHVQLARRGGRDPLHDRRFDADARLADSTTPSARAASARC